MNLTRLVVTFAALVQLAGAGMMDRRLVYDSLRDVEPWQRRQWLAERGLQDYYKAQSWKPTTDSGLRCVGRWSYGPSVKVSLRATADDTIVCLARGSGASIIRFRSQDSLTLDLLSDINCNGIVSRAIIDDTLVFCGMNQGGTGIEVWGVSDLTGPHRLSYVYLPPIMDIAVKDTFLYATGYVRDSLRIFNVADPRNPVQVGACSDSGYPMCVSGDYCYLADRGGINIIDVTDPTSPHRVGKATTGGIALSVAVRDSLCFFGVDDITLRVFNVKNPALPYQVGSLSGIEAHDVYLPSTCDTVLYTPKLHVINFADPANPRQVGFVDCPGWDYGVTAVPALKCALVADYFDGLVAVDITNPTLPHIDTAQFAADMAQDMYIDNDRAYVADYHAGLQILDVASPSTPISVGRYDTSGTRPSMMTAVAQNSFAFVGWSRPKFVSVDVSDPVHPTYAGFCLDVANSAQDMVLRDTYVYVAEDGAFRVVNIARPREPVLVGSCVVNAYVSDLALRDTLAYVAGDPFSIVNVARPSAPFVVRQWNSASGVDIADSVVYLGTPYWLKSVSVARPTAPYVLDSVYLDDALQDVVVVDTLVVGGGDAFHVFSVADPRNLRLLATSAAPAYVQRLIVQPPFIWAACDVAGICVMEIAATGLTEALRAPSLTTGIRVWPTPTSGLLQVEDKSGCSQDPPRIYTVAGARVCVRVVQNLPGRWQVDLSVLPDGVYLVDLSREATEQMEKVIKTKGR